MPRRVRQLTTCPDCGGILQSITPEPLTSTEVQSGDAADAVLAPRQCLICGYEESPDAGASMLAVR